ncbi:hypothetical protein LEMLEM_LOCUS22512 [Lemmus lemmus]
MFCLHVCLCTTGIPGTLRGQKMELDFSGTTVINGGAVTKWP